jgi:pyridoxal phosphate enzyme (YggS family)
MGSGPDTVTERLAEVRERIERAAARAKRRSEDITLVAVSKTHPVEAIREAFGAGVRHFGENRVQEWESKSRHVTDLPAVWHLVGHLQRNKAAHAAALFHRIDSLDSLPLAEKLDRAVKQDSLPVLIEVRLDPIGSKAGCDPKDLPRLAEGVLLMSHLELQGFMAIPPIAPKAERARPAFAKLRKLRDDLASALHRPLPELSMGMSSDFEVAIEEGATQIRLGTAIFGARPQIL